MVNYTIKIKSSAQKELSKLPQDVAERVISKIRTLSEEPRPSGCKKLSGVENSYRIRISDYRVIYSVFDDRLIIQVIKIGHRKNIYR